MRYSDFVHWARTGDKYLSSDWSSQYQINRAQFIKTSPVSPLLSDLYSDKSQLLCWQKYLSSRLCDIEITQQLSVCQSDFPAVTRDVYLLLLADAVVSLFNHFYNLQYKSKHNLVKWKSRDSWWSQSFNLYLLSVVIILFLSCGLADNGIWSNISLTNLNFSNKTTSIAREWDKSRAVRFVYKIFQQPKWSF